jgi:hypothetical protein
MFIVLAFYYRKSSKDSAVYRDTLMIANHRNFAITIDPIVLATDSPLTYDEPLIIDQYRCIEEIR